MLEKHTKQIKILSEKHQKTLKETQANLERLFSKFTTEQASMKKSFFGNNPDPSDFVIPELLEKDEKKRA